MSNEALYLFKEDNKENNLENTVQHVLTNHSQKPNYPKNIKQENSIDRCEKQIAKYAD